MIRCLLVDDDQEIRSSVAAYLGGFDVEVTTVPCGTAMRREMAAKDFEVVILDVMLPDESGLALCQWIQQVSSVPVIMLTAHGDPVSRVIGLELGADDYIGKPFEPRELAARVHAVCRRAAKGAPSRSTAQSVRFEGWTFDRLRRQVISPSKVVLALSSAEFRLLSAFVENPRRVLSRDHLIELTRAPGVEVNDRSIDLAVSRLRGKLSDSVRKQRVIRTVRGEGYMFDTEVNG